MQICNWTGIFADTEGFAVTVADLLSAPSTAPSFAWGHLLCPHRKKCCATARIFSNAHFVSKPAAAFLLYEFSKKQKGKKKLLDFSRSLRAAAAGFAVTVANLLFAPSTAPTFAFGHLLCPHRKKCCATARIFFWPLTSFQNLQQHFYCLISENNLG